MASIVRFMTPTDEPLLLPAGWMVTELEVKLPVAAADVEIDTPFTTVVLVVPNIAVLAAG